MRPRIFSNRPSCVLVAIALAGASGGHAQTNVSSQNKYAWSENTGWINFRDAGSPPGAMGARFHLSGGFASGYAWGENIGWINLGSGAGPYANSSGSDFGVNFGPTSGVLTGYAWSENAGWINFAGGGLAAPRNPARIDFTAKRLRGYAWSENLGWMNLDSEIHFVGVRCPADTNDDGLVNPSDFFAWIDAFNTNNPIADQNGDGVVSPSDFFAWVDNYNAGC